MRKQSSTLLLIAHSLVVIGLLLFGIPFFYTGYWLLRLWIEGEGYEEGMGFVLIGAMQIGVYTFVPGVVITLVGAILRTIAEYLMRRNATRQLME